MPSGPRISDWCYSAPLDSPAPPVVKSREMYENVRLLGRGSFGEVNLVKNVEDNKLFAIKTQLCPKEHDFHNVLREVRFLRTARHPCIIDVHDAFLITNPRIVYIVMHYCESGTISGAISSAKKNKTTLAESQILKWILQLALAMQFLHDNHIIHRDLKPMNVMLTEGGDSLKLADFGLAMSMSEKPEEETTDEAGTPYYTAPEMITREPYSYPADCWSFGVIMHQLLALERPFDGNSTADLVKSILSGEVPPLPAHYSEEIKLISVELLRKDQNERLTMVELLLEPIFHAKLSSFPHNYRPRTLEERIRRSHQKQLEVQIEALNRGRKTDGPRNLHEKVALRQQAAAEAAAAAAEAAALLTSTTESAGCASPVNLVSGTPRNLVSRGSSSVNATSASTRNTTPSGRNLAPSTSGIRLSNAEASAAQAAAAAAQGVSRVPSTRGIDPTVDSPSAGALGSPERGEKSPNDLVERTRSVPAFVPIPAAIPEETAQDIAASVKLMAHAVTTLEAPGAGTAEGTGDNMQHGSGPAQLEFPAIAVEQGSAPANDGAPPPMVAEDSQNIDTIPNSPIKASVSSLSGKASSSGDNTPQHGGRKGQEIARAKEADVMYEAQLGGATPEGVTQPTQPNSPNSKSQSFAGGATAEAAQEQEQGEGAVSMQLAVGGQES